VAVKIIDIDESDTLNPRLADTYSEFMKEVNALKILSESKAKNINHVIEALPVGTAMWMITEYCGGGSIATLVSISFSGRTISRLLTFKDETYARWAQREVHHSHSQRSRRSCQVGSPSRHHPQGSQM
jgi:hypothetical protein